MQTHFSTTIVTDTNRRRNRAGQIEAKTLLVGLLVAGAAVSAVYLLAQSSANQRPIRYIAHVKYQKLDQSTQYNVLNVIKDGVVVTAATAGLAACVGGTFGACAAAAPGVSAIIGGALNDPIITTTADFQ